MISLYNNRPVYKHISAERTLYWQSQGKGWVITPGNPGDGEYLKQGKSTVWYYCYYYTNALLCNLRTIKYVYLWLIIDIQVFPLLTSFYIFLSNFLIFSLFSKELCSWAPLIDNWLCSKIGHKLWVLQSNILPKRLCEFGPMIRGS